MTPAARSCSRSAHFADDNLIWVDMEMTGLQPEVHRVLEVAAIITNKHLEIIAEGPIVAIHQSDDILLNMDEWNTRTHGESGLIARCQASTINEAQCAQIFIDFFKDYVPAGKSPMCGNTIGQDRRFMAWWLPAMESYFHYRAIDVSTLKELVRRWSPQQQWISRIPNKHQAIADIRESIEELRFYRQRIFNI